MLLNTIIDYLNIVHGNSTTFEAVIVQNLTSYGGAQINLFIRTIVALRSNSIFLSRLIW